MKTYYITRILKNSTGKIIHESIDELQSPSLRTAFRTTITTIPKIQEGQTLIINATCSTKKKGKHNINTSLSHNSATNT